MLLCCFKIEHLFSWVKNYCNSLAFCNTSFGSLRLVNPIGSWESTNSLAVQCAKMQLNAIRVVNCTRIRSVSAISLQTPIEERSTFAAVFVVVIVVDKLNTILIVNSMLRYFCNYSTGRRRPLIQGCKSQQQRNYQCELSISRLRYYINQNHISRSHPEITKQGNLIFP